MKFIKLTNRQSAIHHVNIDTIVWFADRTVLLSTGGTLSVDQTANEIIELIIGPAPLSRDSEN